MPRRRLVIVVRAALASALTVVVVGVLAPLASAQTEEWTITPEGLGPIRLDATIDEVRASLPAAYELGDEVPVAPDFDGHIVSVDGAVHAVVATDTQGRIRRIVVLGDEYRTAGVVGPGSLVSDAERRLGDATFTMEAGDSGREIVTFASGPAGLSFRTSEAAGPQAGIYGQAPTTVRYESDARLTSVWIERADADAAADPADTADTDEGDTGADAALPETGVDSVAVGGAALALLFLGFGVVRVSHRLQPWS